jgi:hypothetical protein
LYMDPGTLSSTFRLRITSLLYTGGNGYDGSGL